MSNKRKTVYDKVDDLKEENLQIITRLIDLEKRMGRLERKK